MRIAVCLSGQPRSISVCVASLRANLLGGRKADFFLHLWSRSTLDRIKTFEEYVSQDSLRNRIFRRAHRRREFARYVQWTENILASYDTAQEAIEAQARDAYNPTALVVEPQRVFDTRSFDRAEQNRTTRRGQTRIPNTLSMFFGIWRANELKRVHEQESGFPYDLVIRCRTDLFFFRTTDFAAIRALLGKGVIVPTVGWHRGGVNDQLAFGSSAHLDAYCDTYNQIQDYYATGGLFHPETILRACLDKQGLDLIRQDVDYEIVRGDWSDPEAYVSAVGQGVVLRTNSSSAAS